MKKLLILSLAVTLSLSTAACSKAPAAHESLRNSSQTSEASQSESSADSSEEVSKEDSKADSQTSASSFEALTLADDENCAMKITNIGQNQYGEFTLSCFLENKTDKKLMFSIDNVVVNGCLADPFWASEVAAGKKANQEINWYQDVLDAYQITDVTEIRFDLRVYPTDDWNEDLLNQQCTIYPKGKDAVTAYTRTPAPNEIVLVDNEQCSVIVTDFMENPNNGNYSMIVFLVNKTEDENLMFSVDDASLNGFMIDPFWAQSVPSSAVSFDEIEWYKSDLDENQITKIEEIELTINVYDSDDYAKDDYVNETVTIHPFES